MKQQDADFATRNKSRVLAGVRRKYANHPDRADILQEAWLRVVVVAAPRLDPAYTEKEALAYLRLAARSGAVDYVRRHGPQPEQLTEQMEQDGRCATVRPQRRAQKVQLRARIPTGTMLAIDTLAEAYEQTRTDVVITALKSLVRERAGYLKELVDASDRH